MQTIDLRGIACPTTFLKAKLALERFDSGDIVEILVDLGEASASLTRDLKLAGHRLVRSEERDGHWTVTLEVVTRKAATDDSVKNYPSARITRYGSEPATDPVMVEEALELIVNESRLASIVTTPDLHRELAVGYLVTEGAIRCRDDIEDFVEQNGRITMTIRSFDQLTVRQELRSSGCIGINWENRNDDLVLPVVRRFPIGVILDSVAHLYDATQERTGGVHSASLVDEGGNLRYKALDIGRHNAIDKVVGMAVLNGDDLREMFLVSSGRQPAGMVMKAVRAGIPLIVSKAAPISSGIESALRANLTLCCYATREKVKVFSAPERIIWEG